MTEMGGGGSLACDNGEIVMPFNVDILAAVQLNI